MRIKIFQKFQPGPVNLGWLLLVARWSDLLFVVPGEHTLEGERTETVSLARVELVLELNPAIINLSYCYILFIHDWILDG